MNEHLRARDAIQAGAHALARASWHEALRMFEAAVADRGGAEAFEGLSWAHWWLNDADAMFAARERAYRVYRARGDAPAAARVATWLGTDHVDFRGEPAVAQGWFARARRLLQPVEPQSEHGWLLIHEAEKLLSANATDRVGPMGRSAADLGRRLGIVDLEMMGLATEGIALVTDGRMADGMSRLDEAAAAALGGEFGEIWATAWCCCYVLYACERVRDYPRAAQWCRKIEDWSAQLGVQFVNRVCRAHYAGVLIWRGAWPKAERELEASAARLGVIRRPMAAEAIVRLGDLRRRQGRLDEATEMLEQVPDHPLALLGLAEIRLERSDPASARDLAQAYLREVPPPTTTLRAGGLELFVRALAASGDTDLAKEALAELETIAELIPTDPVRASARFAAGVHAAATGDLEAARTALEDAVRLFHRSGAPFESGRARIELAGALLGLARPRDALRELQRAAASLDRIGAVREAVRARAAAGELGDPRPVSASGLTPRQREVLRLVAAGRSDRSIAEALHLSEHTVHRHVANILAKLGCTSRSAAVAEAVRTGVI